MSEFLRVERAGAVATVWIDRQPKMNAMTVAMRNELPPIFGGLDADATVRVVVVRGAGRSEEHTSELQSRLHLVCRLLLEKKKKSSARRICPPTAAPAS